MSNDAISSAGPVGTSTTTTPKRLTGNLGVTAIVFMVVAAAAPLTVVGGTMPLGFGLGNGLGLPVTFVIAAVILCLFTVGLSRMSRVVSKPGAFYTYIREGLGDTAGTAAAFVAVASYIVVPLATSAYAGVQLNLAVSSLGGPEIPWWIYSLATVAIIGVIGYRSIDLTSRVLGVLLVGEVLVVAVLAAVVLAVGGDAGLTSKPFEPSNLLSGNIGLAMMFAITGFIGFEATAVFRDEARDPVRTVPRATYISVTVIGLFYTFAAYVMIVAWGPDNVVAQAISDPAGMLVGTTDRYLGAVGVVAAQALLITSILACILAFHNVTARYLHALAGDGMLPRKINSIHAVHGSPAHSSLIVTGVSIAFLLVAVILGLDPVTQVFAWFSSLITVGVIILMIATGIAVLVYFTKNRSDSTMWTCVGAPTLSVLGLGISLFLLVQNFPMLVGGSRALAYTLLGIFPIAALVGVAVAKRKTIERHRKPLRFLQASPEEIPGTT